jgi:hypothetical protein
MEDGMRWLLVLLIVVMVLGGIWLSRKAFAAGRSARRRLTGGADRKQHHPS